MYFVLMTFVITLVSASSAMLAGCVLPDVKQAIEAAPVLFVPQIFFSGFFIRIEQIPVWLRWCQYLCFLKYVLNVFMIIEFSDCPGVDSTGRSWQSQCDDLLQVSDVDKDHWWVYLLVLIGLIVGYRTLAMIALKAKAKSVYSAR